MTKHRHSVTLSEEDAAFMLAYADRKGIKGGIAGLFSITVHAYVTRNKARGLTPPWESAETTHTSGNGIKYVERVMDRK
ncbi:MAG: hypothetical protein IMZ54_12315 [Acidobacteria bacterium]|nr:hypothetical protein [Spirochaetota bacterium]MBE3131482.1 hypothetical protein [Acidobacteriota bacterium]